jgi:hypothetical protein
MGGLTAPWSMLMKIARLEQLWNHRGTDDPDRSIDRARQQLGEQSGDVNVLHGVGRVAVHADRRVGVQNAERLADAVALQERVLFVPGDRLAEECVQEFLQPESRVLQ